MNERIKELMVKSGAYNHYEINEGVNGDELPMVKFAELIVKECVELFDGNEQSELGYRIGDRIYKHFGVK
jgi:hypothetical protein